MKQPLNIILCEPRGFCAGVNRAILIVEQALAHYGKPVYVRHEIVHNKHVVCRLEKMGAIFVSEIDEISEHRPVIFSAHGVPKIVPSQAQKVGLPYIDATCPLVSKVHREAEHYQKNSIHIILIGHRNHPEVIGTMGQVGTEHITLVENKNDVALLAFPPHQKLAYLTQTTLSVDDTKDIIDALIERYPHIYTPKKDDICYATTNRQLAIKTISMDCDIVLVIGSQNSSNSQRLLDVAKQQGVDDGYLINDYSELNLSWLHGKNNLGITAGASAPEYLVEELLHHLCDYFDLTITTKNVANETTYFKLPKMPSLKELS